MPRSDIREVSAFFPPSGVEACADTPFDVTVVSSPHMLKLKFSSESACISVPDITATDFEGTAFTVSPP